MPIPIPYAYTLHLYLKIYSGHIGRITHSGPSLFPLSVVFDGERHQEYTYSFFQAFFGRCT